MFLISRFSSETLVMVGGFILAVGSALFVYGSIWFPQHQVSTVAVPGAVIMAGVGLSMPHCKSGSLQSVEEDMTSQATSLLKIMQLVFSSLASFIAGIIYKRKIFEIAAELLVLNGGVYIFYMVNVLWRKSRKSF